MTLKWPPLIVKLKHFADFICFALYLHFCRQTGLGVMLSKTSNSFQRSNKPSCQIWVNNVYGVKEQLSSAEEVIAYVYGLCT